MLALTLDTNCLLAVDEQRPEALAIRRLADAHREGRANVALVAISASERQRDGGMLESYSSFMERVNALDLGHLELLLPMCYWDVMFWDACLWVEPDMAELESKVQQILFPGIPASWSEYCRMRSLDAENTALDRKWKNAKCDVQAFWCHAYRRRDVFVTSDRNFHAATKKPSLRALAGGRIELPDDACSLVDSRL